MNVGDYCKETLDQLPQNWKDVVAEYKEATAGKDIGAVLQDWFEIVKKDYLNFDGTVSRKDYAVYFLPARLLRISATSPISSTSFINRPVSLPRPP